MYHLRQKGIMYPVRRRTRRIHTLQHAVRKQSGGANGEIADRQCSILIRALKLRWIRERKKDLLMDIGAPRN